MLEPQIFLCLSMRWRPCWWPGLFWVFVCFVYVWFFCFFFFFSNRHLALSLKKCLTACDKALSIPQSFSVISAVGGVRWYGELHWNANLSCYLLFKLSWQDPPQPKQNKNPSFFFFPLSLCCTSFYPQWYTGNRWGTPWVSFKHQRITFVSDVAWLR